MNMLPGRSTTIPSYIVNEQWMAATHNTDLLLDVRPPANAWATLVIEDEELDRADLLAIEKWEKELTEEPPVDTSTSEPDGSAE